MGTDLRYFDAEYAHQLMQQFTTAAAGCSSALGGNYQSEIQVGYLPLKSNRDMNADSFRNMGNLIEECSKNPNIKLLGRVSDNDLIRYYSNAVAFIFPSLYEGFGIPVLEAQACGCPVISSNSSSLPEILGDSALMCDPNNTNEFANAVLKLVNHKSLKEILIDKGYENIKRFSWEKSAEKLLGYL